jgi:hypothetical protein
MMQTPQASRMHREMLDPYDVQYKKEFLMQIECDEIQMHCRCWSVWRCVPYPLRRWNSYLVVLKIYYDYFRVFVWADGLPVTSMRLSDCLTSRRRCLNSHKIFNYNNLCNIHIR